METALEEVGDLAAEAVLRLKEAENDGSELIRQSSDEAREIVRKAEIDCAAKKKAIIAEAEKMKTAIIEATGKKAEAECSELVKAGRSEKERILNPDTAKLEAAVKMVTDKILAHPSNDH